MVPRFAAKQIGPQQHVAIKASAWPDTITDWRKNAVIAEFSNCRGGPKGFAAAWTR